MNGWMRKSAAFLALAALWMSAVSAVRAMDAGDVADADGPAPRVWADVLARPAGEREAMYREMTFDAGGWQTGDVLAREPFVVVTEAGAEDSDAAAKVRVWTGWLARVGDDLVTVWDEIWIGPDGKAVLAVAGMETAIPDYFRSPGQHVYRNLEYVGRYPWAFIPTDREADEANLPRLGATGVTNFYGLEPEGEADIEDAPAVKPLPVMPDRIRPGRVFPEVEIREVPKDIENHWARDNILDLMRKGIVTGYADGTIRPQKTLTRAEFIVLLLRSLQLEPSGAAMAPSHADVKSHWAGPVIAEAERLGILPPGEGGSAFAPDEPASRLEMAGWIAAALKAVDRADEGPAVSFTDTGGLTAAEQRAIRMAVNHGILQGYPDGSFRPERALTRAEAFTVASRLAAL